MFQDRSVAHRLWFVTSSPLRLLYVFDDVMTIHSSMVHGSG